ncbi:MAG: hypothetical protein J6Z49_09595 [Kiritimatiellae bacterium]|nr:hypothetical protein [Kiritimatiellia bacterium]
MMRSLFFLSLCAVSFPVSAGEGRFDLVGDLDREGVASAALPFDVYRACGAGASRLRKELRVYDSDGMPQPFLIRNKGTFTRVFSTRYTPGSVTGLTENPDGSVTFIARYTPADGVATAKYTELRLNTPLQNFAQFVTVLDEATGKQKLAEGRIYDYSRFANVQNTTIQIPGGLPASFRIVIRKPVTEVEKAEFERIVQKGAVPSETIRRVVSEQVFKLRSLEIGERVESFRFKEADPVALTLPGGRKDSGCYSYTAFSAPVVSGEAHVNGSYWAFTLRTLRTGETPPGRQQGYRLARLPEDGSGKTTFPVRPDEIDGSIHLFPDFEDAAPATFADPAFTFKQIPQEIVFLGKPGIRYHLAFDRTGKDFRFPQDLRNYLERARDTIPLRLQQQGEFAAAGISPFAAWFRRHGVTALSVAALAILTFFCLRMFGKTATPTEP